MSTFESLIDNLTPKQEELLRQFRITVNDVLQPKHDDFFLLRWLKARDFDPTKAELMLRKSMEWRKKNDVDHLLEWDPPSILKHHWPGGIYGFDKIGHPILWQVCNDFDSIGMMKSVKLSDIIKYHIYRMEKIMKICEIQTKKLGQRIGSAVHISDLQGFTLKMVFTPGISDTMKEIFALYEANYPEHLHSSYVINAPSVFAVFFRVIRPLLSEETKRKVNILGKNWSSRILDVVPLDQLPCFWGGNARAPDEGCSDYINHCPSISPSLYLRDQITVDHDRMTSATVPRSGVLKLTYNVTIPGTVIRWMFETDDKDIGFGVFYQPDTPRGSGTELYQGQGQSDKQSKKDKPELEELFKMLRVNSQLIPEDGNIRCAKPGTYILQFDNSYSWVASKKLFYEVELLEPDGDSIFEECLESVNTESTYL